MISWFKSPFTVTREALEMEWRRGERLFLWRSSFSFNRFFHLCIEILHVATLLDPDGLDSTLVWTVTSSLATHGHIKIRMHKSSNSGSDEMRA
jgi:hypothetical protein